jgi:pyruvyl transferase EpsO
LDSPDYPNVGDSAILLGELTYLREELPDARVTLFDNRNYSASADAIIDDADLILLHGGGNFGDLWPRHEEFRLHILSKFNKKRTIQFPQSIHFSDPGELGRMTRAIEQHSDFLLCVRDQKSFEFAKKSFSCEVHLCPDMAFAMKPIARKPPVCDCVGLLRSDKEVKLQHAPLIEYLREQTRSVEIVDWLQDQRLSYGWLEKFVRKVVRKAPGFPFVEAISAEVRRRYANERLQVGIEMLSRGKFVVTDRLHAHILCCLLGIPHAPFDSMDGKISAFHNTWLSGYYGADMCAEPEDIEPILRQYL